jgi:hypothetical protein
VAIAGMVIAKIMESPERATLHPLSREGMKGRLVLFDNPIEWLF